MILQRLHRPIFGELNSWTTAKLAEGVASLPAPFQQPGDVVYIRGIAQGTLPEVWDDQVHAYSEAAAQSVWKKEIAFNAVGLALVAGAAFHSLPMALTCLSFAAVFGVNSLLSAREAARHVSFCRALSFRWLPALKQIDRNPKALEALRIYAGVREG